MYIKSRSLIQLLGGAIILVSLHTLFVAGEQTELSIERKQPFPTPITYLTEIDDIISALTPTEMPIPKIKESDFVDIDLNTAKMLAEARGRQLWSNTINIISIIPIRDAFGEIIAYDVDVSTDGKRLERPSEISIFWQKYLQQKSRNNQHNIINSIRRPYAYLTISANFENYPIRSSARMPSNYLAVGWAVMKAAQGYLNSSRISLVNIYADGFWARNYEFSDGERSIIVQGHEPWKCYNTDNYIMACQEQQSTRETTLFDKYQERGLDYEAEFQNILEINKKALNKILFSENMSSRGCEDTCLPPCGCVSNLFSDFEPLEWHFGCSPTSGAMILNYWDNYAHFGKLNQLFYYASDLIENNFDCHIASAQEDLAEHMGTYPPGHPQEGATEWENIYPGLINHIIEQGYSVSNGINLINMPPTVEFYWDEMTQEINSGFPFVWSNTFIASNGAHSVAAVGYDSNTEDILYYNTWRSTGGVISRAHFSGSIDDITTIASPHLIVSDLNYDAKILFPDGQQGFGNTSCSGDLQFIEGTTVAVAWNSYSKPSEYVKIYYTTDGGFYGESSWNFLAQSDDSGSFLWEIPIGFMQGGLNDAVRLKIEQYDENGNILSADSSYGNFTILPCLSPDSFFLTSPSQGQILASSTTSVTLYWQQSANATHYELYFDDSPDPPLLTSTSNTSYPVNVTAGNTYYWRVVAKTSCNDELEAVAGPWSFSIIPDQGSIIASASPNPVPLNDPSTISIQVNDGSGNPVGAGYTVTCSTQYTGLFSGNNASSMYSPSSVLTDANGQTWIRFTSWTPGTAQITVDCEGATTIVPITFEEPQPGDYDLDILVSYDGGTSTYSEYSIAVLVKDLATGTPVSGVSVHLTSIPSELIDEYDTTDANGVASYILTVNESGDVTLTAEAGNSQESTSFYAQVGSGPPPPIMDPLATYTIGGDGAGVCFSPDGTTLVAGGESSADVYAWYTSTWSQKWHQRTDYNVQGQIDVSPDSSKVLVAAGNGPEILTNSKNLSPNAPDLPLAEEAVLAHWRDNSVYYYTTETALYSSASSSPLYTLPNDDTFELESHLDYNAASGGRLTAGTLDGYVYVWNTSGGVVFSAWLDDTCVDTVFSDDGSKLAVTWQTYPTIKVYRTSDWQVINMPAANFGNVFGACFIDNGTKLAVGGNSKIVIFDLSTNQQFRSADVSGEVIELSWNESIQKLAAGTSYNLVYVFSPLSSDGIAPVINVTHPPEGYVTNMASLTTTGRVSDNVGVIAFTINGTPVPLDGSGNFSHTVGLSAGENTITYYAKDAMNNNSTVTRHVTRVTDQTPPVISNVSVTPDSGIVGTMFTIQCDVQDGDSGVASVTAVVTGGNGPFSVAMNLESGYTYTGEFDSSNAIPGYYLVDIEAVDSSPNANSRIVEDAAGFFVNAPCVYSIDPTSASFGPAGGSETISVTTTSGCSWTATEQLDWVTITSGAAGTGNGTVSYTVSANGASSPRQGTISIAGQLCTISQEGFCTYQVVPTQSTAAAAGDDVSYTVTTDPECSWVVVEDVSWLNVLQGLSGTGNGTVLVEVLPNPDYTERQGQFSIAGTPVGITQLGQTQPGDLDGDGQIGASDLQLLADFLANNLSIQTLEADFNSDLRIDAVDLEILIQYLAGNITEIPFVNEETIIYEEDFTPDPQYSTAFPDDCYWDSVNGWYYARVHDVSTGYGHYYGDSPLFGPVAAGQSFHCEFDFNVVLQDWGNYPGVFMRNSLAADPWSPVPWYFCFAWADSSYKKFCLRDTGSAHMYESGTVTQDRWYHVVVDYDAAGQVLDIVVTDLSTGSTFWELYDQPFVITEPFDMLSIGQRTTPPAYGDISIILVDDILISR
ncbi:MAG: C39 family peptidase [Acidobacteria bacterium]|nr:C39 family peptidase [Acidobacteriota bacterium]